MTSRVPVWASRLLCVLLGVCLVTGLPTVADATFEIPAGETITDQDSIQRSIPQKEAYELYDPAIGRNFDLKNFWMRADLRVRPEWRNGTCFGGASPIGGACNSFGGFNGAGGASATSTNGQAGLANPGASGNDFYIQQWARLGVGYDLSPDVNFYLEIIDSATWGGNGDNLGGGDGGDPLTHNGGIAGGGGNNGRLGVRAAYVLIRNLSGVRGLSLKAGRQYLVFGNNSLFGHFDWANTGFSHDGVMLSYSTKKFESYLGWFRNSESDIGQATPVGSGQNNLANGASGTLNNGSANLDADMIIFYNQLKSISGFLIEPYYVHYRNNLNSADNAAQGLGTPKHSQQIRHMIGNRTELRKGNWDAINETAWQFGHMADGLGISNQRNVSINAWATRNWLGYTWFEFTWKPRVAVGFDYASGDGNANCSVGGTAQAGYACRTANTFENFFPTNFIHTGFMLNAAWKNSIQPQINIQARPTRRDHVEFWAQMHYLPNARDNWYRGSQGVLVFSKPDNTSNHAGNEVDFAWTRMFADGKVSLSAIYGHFFSGDYVRANLGTNRDQDWGVIQLWMNF
jgi:hypothetical protein